MRVAMQLQEQVFVRSVSTSTACYLVGLTYHLREQLREPFR